MFFLISFFCSKIHTSRLAVSQSALIKGGLVVRNRQLVVAVVVLLLALGLSQVASAGGPDGFFVSSYTGTYFYGSEVAHDAQYWIIASTAHTQEWSTSFLQDWGTGTDYSQSSWVAFVRDSDILGSISTYGYPSLVEGYFWSGTNETRTSVPLEVAMYGQAWGTRKFTLFNPDGTTAWSTILTGNGISSGTTLLPLKRDLTGAGTAYTFQLTQVPEPTSLLALLSGLGGFVITRRRKH